MTLQEKYLDECKRLESIGFIQDPKSYHWSNFSKGLYVAYHDVEPQLKYLGTECVPVDVTIEYIEKIIDTDLSTLLCVLRLSDVYTKYPVFNKDTLMFKGTVCQLCNDDKDKSIMVNLDEMTTTDFDNGKVSHRDEDELREFIIKYLS